MGEYIPLVLCEWGRMFRLVYCAVLGFVAISVCVGCVYDYLD